MLFRDTYKGNVVKTVFTLVTNTKVHKPNSPLPIHVSSSISTGMLLVRTIDANWLLIVSSSHCIHFSIVTLFVNDIQNTHSPFMRDKTSFFFVLSRYRSYVFMNDLFNVPFTRTTLCKRRKTCFLSNSYEFRHIHSLELESQIYFELVE